MNTIITPRDRVMSLIEDVAKSHNQPVAAIFGNNRTVPVVMARFEAVWRVKHETNYSLPKMGRLFKRDHTTILHSLRRYEEMNPHALRPQASSYCCPLCGKTADA